MTTALTSARLFSLQEQVYVKTIVRNVRRGAWNVNRMNVMRELWCVNRDERRERNLFPDLPWIQNDFLAPATEFGVDPTGC